MSLSRTIDVSAKTSQNNDNQHNSQNLSTKQQQQLQKMFDDSKVQNYFASVQKNLPLQILAIAQTLYTASGTQKISQQIKAGDIQVNQEPQVLDEEFLKRKINIQQKKAMELKLKKSQIEQKLKYLQLQTSLNLSMKAQKKQPINPEFSDEYRPPNVLSKQQHQSYMAQMIRAREQRDRRHQQIVTKLEMDIKQQQEKLKQMKTEKMNKQKENRRRSIEKKLQKNKEQHKRMIEQELKSRQQYQKIKNKQFLHEKIEAKFQNEVLLPALQQKKKKLKEIREMSKAFDVKQLIKHEKQYIQKRQQSFSVVKSNVNQNWNYKPPEKHERLTKVLEEQKLEQRKKLEQKKRLIDQKIQRQSNFISYLKQKFSPAVDQNKQRQLQERVALNSKPKRRQSAVDSKTIGNSYLEQAKRMKRQRPQRPETQKNSDLSLQRASTKGKTDYLVMNRKQREYYEQKRRKRLQNLIKSQNSSQMQKITKLKRENDKLSEAYIRRTELARLKKQDINEQEDALQLLLSGIKAKMGIINLYNKNTNHQQYETL